MTKKQEEGEIKKQIRNVLRMLHIPHRNIVQSAFSDHGISDLIATVPPTGRSLYIEVKAPGYRMNTKTHQEQVKFLNEMQGAGALIMVATRPHDVITYLAVNGYAPAQNMQVQVGANR